MGNYSFWQDLKQGKLVETIVAKKLAVLLGAAIVEVNNDYRYDFKLARNGVERTYEVKNDLMCGKTGNFALEYECRGKPSGIETTEADYWVYNLDDGVYMIPVDALKNLINSKSYFRMVTGGDKGSNTKMFLFKLPFIKAQMIKI